MKLVNLFLSLAIYINHLDLTNISKSVKKKLIQKIRNRMSAQRSRIKQKLYFKRIEKENNFLKTEIHHLNSKNQNMHKENNSLKKEIEILKQKLQNSTQNIKNNFNVNHYKNTNHSVVANKANSNINIPRQNNVIKRQNSQYSLKSKIGRKNLLLLCLMVVCLISNFNENNASNPASSLSSSSFLQSDLDQILKDNSEEIEQILKENEGVVHLGINDLNYDYFDMSVFSKKTKSSSPIKSSIVKKNGLVPFITTNLPLQKNREETLYELCLRYAKLNINQSCKCKSSEQVLKLPNLSKRNSNMSIYSLQNQFSNDHSVDISKNSNLDIFSDDEISNLFFKKQIESNFSNSSKMSFSQSRKNLIKQKFKNKIYPTRKIRKSKKNNKNQLFVCKAKSSKFTRSDFKFDLILNNDNYEKIKNTSANSPLYFDF